jgi:hypothetical protein
MPGAHLAIRENAMSQVALRFVGAPEAVIGIEQLAGVEGVTLSSRQPIDRTSEPLNAPITGGDIIQAAQMVSAIFASSSAAVVFLDKLLDFVRKIKQPIEIRRPSDRRSLLVTPDTDRSAIERFCSRV